MLINHFKYSILIALIIAFLLSGKLFSQDRPSSSNLGQFPTGTGMEINQAGGFNKKNTYYFPDAQLFKFKKEGKHKTKMKHSGFGWNGFKFSNSGKTLYPRTQKVSENLYFQETEVTNLEWKEYLYFTRLDSGEQYYASMLPDQSKLPCPNYFYDNFYNLYPLVGINYDQAKAYCNWKTEVANIIFEVHCRKNIHLTFRLPTQEEWELAVADNDYTTDDLPVVKISIDGHSYLRKLLSLKESTKDVKKKVVAFNRANKPLYPIHCLQEWSPFQIQNYPQYVYSFPHNQFNLFHMRGNVFEMLDNKGLAIGGSYLTDYNNSISNPLLKYETPKKDLGFRTICEVKYQ